MDAAQSQPTPTGARSGRPSADGPGTLLTHNIAAVVHIEQRERLRMSWSDHIADWVTRFAGSMTYIWLPVGWFTFWLLFNAGWFLTRGWDPFPFALLTMVVTLEAIFLATVVLISQNAQARLADRLAKVGLQVEVIAEQELTKLISMVERIERRLGTAPPAADRELAELRRPTHLEELADAIDATERRIDPKGARGPESAVDTEA